jgi:hypothetical protein
VDREWQENLQQQLEMRFDAKGRDIFHLHDSRFACDLKFRVNRSGTITNVEITPVGDYCEDAGVFLLKNVIVSMEGEKFLKLPDKKRSYLDVEIHFDRVYKLISK